MQYKVKIMKKALGKFLLILLAMSFISSFIPAGGEHRGYPQDERHGAYY